MKKIIIAILAVIMFVSMLSVSAFASTTPAPLDNSLNTSNDNLHLLNPVAVTINQDKLYIADNVTETQSAIHIFDISAEQPAFIQSLKIEGNILRLQTIDNSVYALQSNAYIEINNTDYTYTTTKTKTPRIDMTIVDGTHVFITEKDQRLGYDINGQEKFFNEYNCSKLVAVGITVYFLSGTNYNYFEMEDFGNFGTDIPVDEKTTGILNINGKVATFTDTEITFQQEIPKTTYTVTPQGKLIRDIASNKTDLYVLSDNVVTKWIKDSDSYKQVDDFTVGSDTVKQQTPDLNKVTGYTLATANSYPANIIYKTINSNNSIPELIDNASQYTFIILSYEGDNSSSFYYVYVNGKFGWIKKSADNIEQDNSLDIIDTKVGNSVIQYKSSFVSAKAVYIYSLPCDTKDKDLYKKLTHEQSSTNRTEVTLLQQFTASDGTKWYYIKFEDNGNPVSGFVLQTEVGQIYSTATSNDITLDQDTPQLKINALLWDNVGMYLTEDLNEEQKLVDKDTQQHIKLRSGIQVNVIERKENSSFIQVVNSNKTFYYGWVDNDRLIPATALTTNTIVGLIITIIAIALTVTCVLIILKRKKVAKKNPVIDLD